VFHVWKAKNNDLDTWTRVRIASTKDTTQALVHGWTGLVQYHTIGQEDEYRLVVWPCDSAGRPDKSFLALKER